MLFQNVISRSRPSKLVLNVMRMADCTVQCTAHHFMSRNWTTVTEAKWFSLGNSFPPRFFPVLPSFSQVWTITTSTCADLSLGRFTWHHIIVLHFKFCTTFRFVNVFLFFFLEIILIWKYALSSSYLINSLCSYVRGNLNVSNVLMKWEFHVGSHNLKEKNIQLLPIDIFPPLV